MTQPGDDPGTPRETTTIEAIGGGPNQRIYVPQPFRVQHAYPFRGNEPIALQVVESDDGRPVVVLTKDTVRVALDETSISLERAESDIQGELPLQEADSHD